MNVPQCDALASSFFSFFFGAGLLMFFPEHSCLSIMISLPSAFTVKRICKKSIYIYIYIYFFYVYVYANFNINIKRKFF